MGKCERVELWIALCESSPTRNFTLREHLDFGEPHVAPRLFSFLCCVVLLCLFVFVMCHVYSTVPVSLSCTFHIAPWIFSNFDLLETLFMTY